MVRYADGPTTEVEVHIEAPPSAVWPIICDIEAPAAFSEEFQGADWVDGDRPALGNSFRGRNRHRVVGEWSVVCVITAFVEERTFEWTIGEPEFPAARWRFDLEPDGDGSHLRFTAQIGPAPSGLTPAIERMPEREAEIVSRRLGEHRANMERTVEGYRRLAEQRGAG